MDLLLSFPILGLLLLVAGVLIGHMLWGRVRTEDKERIQRLSGENENLHSEVDDQRRAYEQLESSLELHRQDEERLKQANEQLQHLQEQHKTLKDALARAEQNANRVQTLSDKLQVHVANFHEERDQFVEAVQIRLKEQSKQIEKLTSKRDDLVSELGVARSDVSGLSTTVERQEAELDTLRKAHAKAAGHEETVVSLRKELESTTSQLSKEQHQREHLQSVLDGRKVEYDNLLQDVEKLETAFQKMCLQNEKLTEESSLLASLRLEHKDLQTQLQEQDQAFRNACEQRDTHATNERQHVQTINGLKSALDEMQQLEAARAQDLTTLRGKYDDKVKELKQVSEACDEVVAVNQRVEAELEQLREKDLVQLKTQWANQTECRRIAEEARDTAERELNRIKGQELPALTAELASQSEASQQLTERHTDLTEQHTDLTAKHSQLTEKYDQLAEQHDQLAADHEQLNQQQEKLEKELDDSLTSVREKDVQLEALREGLTKLEEESDAKAVALAESAEFNRIATEEKQQLSDEYLEREETLKASVVTATAQAETLSEQLQRSNQSNQQLTETVDSLRAQLKSKTIELRDTCEECDDLISANESAAKNVEDLTKQVADLEEKCTELETARKDLRVRHEDSSVKLQDLLSENAKLETCNSESQEMIAKLDAELETLRQQHSEAESTLAQSQQHAVSSQERVSQLETELENTKSSYKTAQDRLTELEEQIAGLEAKHSAAEGSLVLTRAEKANADSRISKLQDQVVELESKQTTVESDLDDVKARYQDKIAELNANEVQIVDLKNQLEQAGDLKKTLTEQNDRLQKIVSERELALQSSSQVHTRVRDLEQELDKQSREFTSISQQHQQLQAQLKIETDRYQAAEEELAAQRKRIEGLESELKELEALRAEHRQLQSQLADVKSRLLKMTSDHRDQVESNQLLTGQVVALRRHNVSNEETIRDLRRERAAVLDRLRQRQAATPPAAPAPLKVVRYQQEPTSGKMTRDESLGLIYTEAPSESDDLKEIYGVATVLEQKLNDFGVYTYRQIMEWDSKTIEEFSKRLSFRDRIQRDEWVAQARRLHREKYGDDNVRRAA